MAKAPAFQFYPGDWRRDTQVQMASMATRGVWMEMLCCMWDAPERGVLSGANDQIARLLGCAKEEFALALKEIETLQIADVLRDCNGVVTIKSRRMQRDEKERKNTKIRVARARKKAVQKDDVTVETRKCNANVTVASSSSSSTSLLNYSCANAPKSTGANCTMRFAEFWNAYPVRKNKKKCREKWKARKLDKKADMIIADVKNRSAHDRQWIEGFIPLPTTYINGDRWDDEIDYTTPGGEKLSPDEKRIIKMQAEMEAQENNERANV